MRIPILIVFILWSLGSWWYYTCRMQHACGGDDSTTATTIPNLAKPLQFKWSSFNIPLDSGFPGLKAAILKSKAPNKVLELTGNYFPSEINSDDYSDLGIARATKVKEALLGEIPEEQIQISSSNVLDTDIPQDSLVEGVHFRWIDKETEDLAATEENTDYSSETTDEAPESTEESSDYTYASSDLDSENHFVKYFPSNQTKIPAELEQFLDDLANKLVAENKKVLIRGHTDSAGDKELNFKVGLRRAKKVRDQLKKRGVLHKNIETTSDGEESPVADNRTEAGRKLNRRIEIFIKD